METNKRNTKADVKRSVVSATKEAMASVPGVLVGASLSS